MSHTLPTAAAHALATPLPMPSETGGAASAPRGTLGPATVMSAAVAPSGASVIELLAPDGRVSRRSVPASIPYQLTRGDQLLVWQRGSQLQIVGVLQTRGTATLRNAAGDIRMTAAGSVAMIARDAVRTRAPRVEVRASKVTWVARVLRKHLGRLIRIVRGTSTTRGGSANSVYRQNSFEAGHTVHSHSEDLTGIHGQPDWFN